MEIKKQKEFNSYSSIRNKIEHIKNEVHAQIDHFTYENYTDKNVQIALNKENLTFYDFGSLLSPVAENFLEQMAVRAKNETRKHFGNAICLYTPLYLSNYCENHCIYCGFSCENDIKRGKLSFIQIEKELKAISNTGLREILLLTGEDRKHSNIEYIAKAIKLATKYFSTIGVEIYPLSSEEYNYIHQSGADFVSIYQETYDNVLYDKLHISGPKKDYSYRFDSQERAIKGGIRGVSFGVLLGLGDFRKDAFATGLHAYILQQKYPHTEISFSVPRIKIFNKNNNTNTRIFEAKCTEKNLLQTILAYRIFMPFASIAISTRERAGFRDNIIGIAATKISAEVKTSVGGHVEKKGDEQFIISDSRDVTQIHNAILSRGLQPVYNDYIRV